VEARLTVTASGRAQTVDEASAPCRCWRDTNALGHDGHCCFVHGDRKVNGGFKDDEAICHVTEGVRIATT
jgi:hypothetical protein